MEKDYARMALVKYDAQVSLKMTFRAFGKIHLIKRQSLFACMRGFILPILLSQIFFIALGLVPLRRTVDHGTKLTEQIVLSAAVWITYFLLIVFKMYNANRRFYELIDQNFEGLTLNADGKKIKKSSFPISSLKKIIVSRKMYWIYLSQFGAIHLLFEDRVKGRAIFVLQDLAAAEISEYLAALQRANPNAKIVEYESFNPTHYHKEWD